MEGKSEKDNTNEKFTDINNHFFPSFLFLWKSVW